MPGSNPEIPRRHAEQILQRDMAALRELIDNNPQTDIFIKPSLQRIFNDLGVLGMALAGLYGKEEDYKTTLRVMAQENVNLLSSLRRLGGRRAIKRTVIH